MQTKLKSQTHLVGFNDIRIEPIQGWQDFLAEGEDFLAASLNAYSKQSTKFTPDILYNITCMAIEKFIMAALMKHGALPYNHTMADLVEAMETTFGNEIARLKDGLLELDRYQEICDVETFMVRPVRLEDIPAMLELAKEVRSLTSQQIKKAT